jgi:plasmid stabilization system protein ParE
LANWLPETRPAEMALIILEPAQAELDDAQSWYEVRKVGLGDRLFAEFLGAVESIVRTPGAWHPLPGGFRRYWLDRFPYGVIYAIRGSDIIIVAFTHHRRRPGYWRQRLA